MQKVLQLRLMGNHFTLLPKERVNSLQLVNALKYKLGHILFE